MVRGMTTLAEIENAMSNLSADELAHLEVTLRRLREGAEEASTNTKSSSAAPAIERQRGVGAFPTRADGPITSEPMRPLDTGDGI